MSAGAALSGPFASALEPQPRQADTSVRVEEQPSAVSVFLDGMHPVPLERAGDRWEGAGVAMTAEQAPGGLRLSLEAPASPVERVHLRWNAPVATERLRVLGDAWERSYGELGWREVIPEQPMPWYFLSFDGQRTHGYGVATGAAAFAFWQVDREGVSLWLDVRNGGAGVRLGSRRLAMATVIARPGEPGETPMAAARALCKRMCPSPRPLSGPIYGSNDWYYAYGKSSAAAILRDAELIAELVPDGDVRPFATADEGWANRTLFPDMPGLAAAIRGKRVRPGIWIRPLRAPRNAKNSVLLPGKRFATGAEREGNASYDPTIPEGLEDALSSVREVKAWGFELIKHDFSTYDLLGQWGSAMGASPALPGWSFHDGTLTSAEIIRNFYLAIREAAGDAVVVGCNTVGHLSAGIFEADRIGDDVSGKQWERTRRMGVNTLGFRLPQHGTFFCADPDCVPVTPEIPWELTRQWLDVVARSGAALVISPDPRSFGPEQKEAVRRAFSLAAGRGPQADPVDWFATRTPAVWRAGGGAEQQTYTWLEPSGAYPFTV